MPTPSTRWATATKGFALGALLAGAIARPATAQTAYGLYTGTGAPLLATFQLATPGTATNTAITGLASGQTLVGLDSRPATGELFALGYAAASTTVQLYTLSPATGALTAVGSAFTLNLGTNTARIGFDFNPTVDRIRLTGANGSNYRLNPTNGALAATDGNLAYATTDPNASSTPGVGAVAYTNSYIGATATTLYDVDEANSRLLLQNPPNNGTLNTVGTISPSLSTVFSTDLDISYNATTGANLAYLAVATQAGSAYTNSLYTVNLTTGALTSVGALGTSTTAPLTDIAVQIVRPATLPVITGQLAYALAGTNLITFDTNAPGTIRTAVGITGLAGAQVLAGLDVRPLTNSLYALGYDPAPTNAAFNAQVYTLNPATGVLTAVGSPIRLELGTGSIGFDFNPLVDRIRVVGANRNNYRLNPLTGALAATDGPVAYVSGNNTPSIGAVAYTNSFVGPTPTATTTLYNYDEVLNVLNTQATANPPADGQLTTVGASGITVNTAAPNVDLDIYSPAVGVNTAYLVANTGTSVNTSLYTVNLATGAATLVGAIGNGLTARDIAVAAATGVVTANRPAELATGLTLYPNPLAGATSLSFSLPRAAHVELTVTDALGRTVDKLDAGLLPAGPQTVRWERPGQAAGLYLFRLSFDGQPAGTRQAVLLNK